MKITQGPIMDRKGPRTNAKELLSNNRQQHAPDRDQFTLPRNQILQLLNAIVLKQDRLWESENSLWENDYHKEGLWRRSIFDQSLTSAHILPEVFHLQRFLLSNKYPYGKMFQNNKEGIKKVNVHHRKNKTFHLF